MSKRKRVGVDIGANQVRVVEVSGVDRDGLAVVTSVGLARTPPGAVVGGAVKDPGQVAFALREALKQARVSPYGVVLGLASPKAALKQISMPAGVKPTEWSSSLRLEGAAIAANVPIEDSALAHNRISAHEEDTNSTSIRLLTAATLSSECEALLATCRLAKVVPRAIDLSAAAAFRGLVRVQPIGNTEVSTIVDIGASKTTVATRAGMHLRSVFTFELGGESITRALSGALSIPLDQAEEIKRTIRVGQVPTKATSAAAAALRQAYGDDTTVVSDIAAPTDASVLTAETVTATADDIVEAIAAAIEQDLQAHPDAPTQVIQMCGGGALLRGMPEQLQARLGVHAFTAAPWVKVTTGARTRAVFDRGSPDPAAVHSLATATGLALWEEKH